MSDDRTGVPPAGDSRPLLASELFCEMLGAACEGPHECHWCSAPCRDTYLHDEPPPVPFLRSRSSARRPNNRYICLGCWLYRRKSVTVDFLSEGFKDRQAWENHSWVLFREGAYALASKEDRAALYQHLLKPPKRWCLALRDGGAVPNLLHLAAANDVAEVTAGTPLHFTVNNVPHAYTVYELEHALRYGPEGTEPGVQALVRLLGPHELPPLPETTHAAKSKDGRGRPPAKHDGKVLLKSVPAAPLPALSGAVT